MKRDLTHPILDEVVEARAKLMAHYHTVDALADALRRKEIEHGRKCVDYSRESIRIPLAANAFPERAPLPKSLRQPLLEEVRKLKAAAFEKAGGTINGYCESLHKQEESPKNATDLQPTKRKRAA